MNWRESESYVLEFRAQWSRFIEETSNYFWGNACFWLKFLLIGNRVAFINQRCFASPYCDFWLWQFWIIGTDYVYTEAQNSHWAPPMPKAAVRPDCIFFYEESVDCKCFTSFNTSCSNHLTSSSAKVKIKYPPPKKSKTNT